MPSALSWLERLARLTPALEEISLRCCTRLKGPGVLALLRNAPALANLDLEGCHDLRLDPVAALQSGHASTLCRLVLSFCDRGTPSALEAILPWAQGLEELSLEGCRAVDDATLKMPLIASRQVSEIRPCPSKVALSDMVCNQHHAEILIR